MFDHVSDFGSIGYVEVDFAIQVNITPNGRVGIDNDSGVSAFEAKDSIEPGSPALHDNVALDDAAIG